MAIAAARADFAQKLQKACDRSPGEEKLFPRARLNVKGALEESLARTPALAAEENFRRRLKQGRTQDARAGGAAAGPHRSDLHVEYAAKSLPADQCSTGEQKALLIGLILAHCRLLAAERGLPPILLLDEVAAHLDENRRAGLYGILLAMKCQAWLTGTDEALFAPLKHQARFLRIENAAVSFTPREKAA